MMNRVTGYVKSTLDGTEKDYSEYVRRSTLFDTYDLSKYLDSIRDQGSVPKCVSVALTDMIYWKMHSGSGKYTNFKFNDSYFFDLRKDKSIQGMQPKEALDILVHTGVTLGILNFKISTYAIIGSVEMAKLAIANNGPVMICLPVKSTNDDFWNGSANYGGHAVLLTGYDRFGFTLRNSWGYSYGSSGYWTLPYSDFNKAYEAWTLIG